MRASATPLCACLFLAICLCPFVILPVYMFAIILFYIFYLICDLLFVCESVSLPVSLAHLTHFLIPRRHTGESLAYASTLPSPARHLCPTLDTSRADRAPSRLSSLSIYLIKLNIVYTLLAFHFKLCHSLHY